MLAHIANSHLKIRGKMTFNSHSMVLTLTIYVLSVSLSVSFSCPELLISSRDEPLLQLAQERSCWNDHRGDMSEAYHGGKLRCYVHIMDQGLCCRVNTLAAYIEANRLVSQTLACSFEGFHKTYVTCFHVHLGLCKIGNTIFFYHFFKGS